MRTHRAPRPRNALLWAIASAVAFVALAASPAGAKAAPKPTTPTTRVLPSNPSLPPAIVNSWALAPSGDTPGQPGTRPDLSYELNPGTEVQDSVTLFNYSNTQLNFRIYATDAFNNADGQFDLLTGDKTPVDAGSWVKLPQANITVPALASAVLPITLKVPPDATPGDHAAAVLASSQAQGTGPDGKIVNLDRRTGSRVYVRVSGPLTPKLDIVRIHGVYHPALNPLSGSLDVTYTVRNRGNERLAAAQKLVLKAPFGIGLDKATPANLPELLPGNSVTLHARFNGVPATALVLDGISLQPVAAQGTSSANPAARGRTGRVLAVPWTVLAVLAAVGLVLYARKAYLRHQQTDVGVGAGGPIPAA